MSQERIAKRMARAGLCSRREAERWIAAGRVTVDGRVIDSPSLNVGPGNRILVDGRPLPEESETRLWLYHKPPGLVVSHKDEKGRPSVFDVLPPELPRVISVGRLDLNSEGLLLLTNDGELARRLELPSTGWTRRYRARIRGEMTPAAIKALKQGVTVDGITYGAIHAEPENGGSGNNRWVRVALKEGRNREVRKALDHVGHPVSRLIRVAYGPFQLGRLKAGEVKEIPRKVLKEQLGKGRQ